MENITAYTDGGCSNNPGPGAWAFVLTWENGKYEFSGFQDDTTNNRMELTAVIKVLEEICRRESFGNRKIDIITDSQYVKKGITEWIIRWEKNGWLSSSRKPVKNKDLWIHLKKTSFNLNIEWKWTRGHSGDIFNERCDYLVQKQIKMNS